MEYCFTTFLSDYYQIPFFFTCISNSIEITCLQQQMFPHLLPITPPSLSIFGLHMQFDICITVTLKRTYSPFSQTFPVLTCQVMQGLISHANSEGNIPVFFSSPSLSQSRFPGGNMHLNKRLLWTVVVMAVPGPTLQELGWDRPTLLPWRMAQAGSDIFKSDRMLCLRCVGVKYELICDDIICQLLLASHKRSN